MTGRGSDHEPDRSEEPGRDDQVVEESSEGGHRHLPLESPCDEQRNDEQEHDERLDGGPCHFRSEGRSDRVDRDRVHIGSGHPSRNADQLVLGRGVESLRLDEDEALSRELHPRPGLTDVGEGRSNNGDGRACLVSTVTMTPPVKSMLKFSGRRTSSRNDSTTRPAETSSIFLDTVTKSKWVSPRYILVNTLTRSPPVIQREARIGSSCPSLLAP